MTKANPGINSQDRRLFPIMLLEYKILIKPIRITSIIPSLILPDLCLQLKELIPV